MNDGSTNPMLIHREVKKTGYLVITSDRGLNGAYNSTILRAVMSMIRQGHANKVSIKSLLSVVREQFSATEA